MVKIWRWVNISVADGPDYLLKTLFVNNYLWWAGEVISPSWRPKQPGEIRHYDQPGRPSESHYWHSRQSSLIILFLILTPLFLGISMGFLGWHGCKLLTVTTFIYVFTNQPADNLLRLTYYHSRNAPFLKVFSNLRQTSVYLYFDRARRVMVGRESPMRSHVRLAVGRAVGSRLR